MSKRILAVFVAVLTAALTSCIGKKPAQPTDPADAAVSRAGEIASASYFSDGDLRRADTEHESADINLYGDEGRISDMSRGTSGSNVTITKKGVYRVTGSSENVSIVVNDKSKSGNVYIVLDNVTMKNSRYSCISVESAKKTVICPIGINNLIYTPESSYYDGAVYSAGDITVNGPGVLGISSSLHGIVCKNDVKLTGGSLQISAEAIGVKADNSVRVGECELIIKSGHDGIQIGNSEKPPFFHMEKGYVGIDAGYDGIDVETSPGVNDGFVSICGGQLRITSGGGAKSGEEERSFSKKGVKCHGDIVICGASVDIDSADDALNGTGRIVMTDGSGFLSSSDDGIHADGLFCLADGKLYVSAAGDGIDSDGSVYISGGVAVIETSLSGTGKPVAAGKDEGCAARITGGTVLALGAFDRTVNFNGGTQCSALVGLSGAEGATVSADDGSGFAYTAKSGFDCVVYSSPYMKEGGKYTLTAGALSAAADFTSGLYHTEQPPENGEKK